MRINDLVTGYLRDRLRELPGNDDGPKDGRDPLDQIQKLGELRGAGLSRPRSSTRKRRNGSAASS
jgi:hypothetical protein